MATQNIETTHKHKVNQNKPVLCKPRTRPGCMSPIRKIYNNITKMRLSLMNSGMVTYGYLTTTSIVNPIFGGTLFLGNLLMANSS